MSKSSVSGGSPAATPAKSLIKSIQRGVTSASSVSVTHVDPANSELRVLGGTYGYASQFAYATRTKNPGTFPAPFDEKTTSVRSISVVDCYLTLDADGNGITRVGSRRMSYELTEFN